MTWFESTSRESIDWTDAELQVRHALQNKEHEAPPALEGRVFDAFNASHRGTTSWAKWGVATALLGALALGWSLSGTYEVAPVTSVKAPVGVYPLVDEESPRTEEVAIEAALDMDVAPIQVEEVSSMEKDQEQGRQNDCTLEALQGLPAEDIDQAWVKPAELKQQPSVQGAQTIRLPASIEVKE